MKTFVRFLAFFSSSMACLASSAGTDSLARELDNTGIRLAYSEFVAQIQEQTARGISCVTNDLRKEIATLAYVRAESAREMLLGNLGYAYLGNFVNPSNTPFAYVGPLVGSQMLFDGPYPSPAALLRIGVPFSLFKEYIEKFSASIDSDFALARVGVSNAGGYFLRYVRGMASGGKKRYHTLEVMTNKALLQRTIVIPMRIADPPGSSDIQTEKIYNTAQHTLLLRFLKEKTSSSSNIVDTISTMGFIRSLDAIPVLADNLTICPQASTNAPGGYVFPAAEALIAIGPAIGDCFARLKATKPLSVEEALWLRISHELYPEGLEYELYCAARTNDLRAARLMQSLPWHRLTEDDMKEP